MPELVACPSCGCKVQMAEMLLGRQARCIACGKLFVACPEVGGPRPRESESSYPLQPPAATPGKERRKRGPGPTPMCPRCHRPVSWEAFDCPHCGHLFDPLDRPGRDEPATRRDSDPHRGKLIDGLGTVCLLAGVLGLPTVGITTPFALATGIPAWVMASHDLERMRTGLVDPAGRHATAFGRNKAIVGVVLALVFGLFYALVYTERFL